MSKVTEALNNVNKMGDTVSLNIEDWEVIKQALTPPTLCKIVYKGIFTERYLKEVKPKKHYFKRTIYYKANSYTEALCKLEKYQDVYSGKKIGNAFDYIISSIMEV